MATVVLVAIMALKVRMVTAVVMAAVAAHQVAPPVVKAVSDVPVQSGLYGGREEVTPQPTREMYKCHISHK